MKLRTDLIDLIESHIEAGNIKAKSHPIYPLTLLSYTPQVQYGKLWDEATLMCRGLIVDDHWEVVARPFSKFFNWGEWEPEKQEKYAQVQPKITEKVDGSLGIVYFWDGKAHIATRGSFTSEQAYRVNDTMIERYYLDDLAKSLDGKATILMEIVAPWNRVVIPYEKEDLILLDILHNETNMPYFHSLIEVWTGKIAKQFNMSLEEALAYETDTLAEGFVLTWDDGEKAKSKLSEYLKVHRLISGMSELRLWERLKDGRGIDDVIDHTPDEFYDWVRKTSGGLQGAFNRIEHLAKNDFDSIMESNPPTRKEFAQRALMTQFPHLMFGLYDARPDKVRSGIWDLIRPKGDKGFWDGNEDM